MKKNNYIAGLEVRHDMGIIPHTFLIIHHPNGDISGHGFAPRKTGLKGNGDIHNDTNHAYNTSSKVIPLTIEQYNKLVSYINKSKQNPPYYDLPAGIQCTNWAMDAMMNAGIMDNNFLLKSQYGRILLSNPWNQGIASTLINTVDEISEFIRLSLHSENNNKDLSNVEKLKMHPKYASLSEQEKVELMKVAELRDSNLALQSQSNHNSNSLSHLTPVIEAAQKITQETQSLEQSQGRSKGLG